ncbi:bifunctional 5,10-methylenetetrahydrofolate dehydrogenase/5,10-methenyltetrahydrofolate cyclohydrolase [Candidatus Kaiserbacteria bacterium]|nr:bifunctional 5,10-methylenetetrahydrofolate dehydrogenase/5,10-methenyltetrahydrofolate cyclohydrolase [Candidatus Kaiserbacteria bacterium]
MIIDGKQIAETLYSALQKERDAFPGSVKLGFLVNNTSPVIASYLKIKERGAARLNVTMVRKELPEDAATADAVAAIEELARNCDGVIPQLPMVSVDIDAVRNAIPKEKDVDILSDEAFKSFESGNWPAVPPVPAACAFILEQSGVPIAGRKIAIVGHGRLVGKPAAVLFKQLGGIVTVLDKGDDIAAGTREADIILLGTGVAGLLKPDMVKEGVAVVDAGTSELGGKVVGDADFSVAEKASVFTPVPRGVGPVAIAEIYKNLFALKKVYGN